MRTLRKSEIFLKMNVCEWLADNKLLTHFVEDKTKYILFSKEENLPEFNITYDNNRINRFHTVEYLGCYLDVNLSEKSMAVKSLKEINAKLQFLYRKNEFLNQSLRRLLCNTFIEPHLDYVSISWHPFVSQKNKK